MSDSTPLTVRIDPSLKAAAEEAARAQGISLTELVQRSMRSYTVPVCGTCGRSSMPNMIAPGFSESFDSFLDEIAKKQPNNPFVILTVEAGRPVVYSVTLRHASRENPLAMSGVVMVKILNGNGREACDAAIPRGWIVGWRTDSDRRWYASLVHYQGFANGNAAVLQRLATPAVPPPKKGGR